MIWQKTSEISFKLNNTLTGHNKWVNSLAVLPNNMFASASDDSYIRICDQITFQCIYILNGNITTGLVAISEYLISISVDQSNIVWDISNSFSKITTTQTSAALFSIALFSNDLFITVNSNGSIEMWSTSSLIFENTTLILNEHNHSVSDLAVLKNGYLVCTSLDRKIQIWDNSFQLWSSTYDSFKWNCSFRSKKQWRFN